MDGTPTRIVGSIALALAATLVLVLGSACDDDEASAEERQEVEETIRSVFASTGADADTFFPRVTDNVIKQVLFVTREECMASPDECIGESAPVESLSDVDIDGDEASALMTLEFGTFRVGLVREDGVWKVDSMEAASDDVPSGAKRVDVELVDFAFVLDVGDLPSDGNLAFRVTNTGEQAHEVLLIAIPEGGDVESTIEAVFAEEVPPLGLKAFIQPGQEDVDMAFESPLGPGHYALVCLFPDTTDPEFAPHVEKGMLAEFTIE